MQAVEIKSGTTFAMDWLTVPRRWSAMAGDGAAKPIVVYGGAESFVLNEARVMSWRAIGA